MDKHRTNIFIALVLVLLIVAGVCAWVTGSSIRGGEPTPEPTDSAEPVSTDEPENSPEPTDTPEPTETPEPSATPTPTDAPRPTDAPQPTPTPDPSSHTRSVDISGSVVCSSGTNLSVQGKYHVSSYDDNNLLVTMDVYAYSYTLHIGSRSGSIRVGDGGKSFTSPGIDVTSDNKLMETKIFSASFTVPCALGESVDIPMSIDWNFNGQYNKKDIKTVSGSETITVQG